MGDAKVDIRAIFCEALEHQSLEERAAYLERACGGDGQLRAHVERLLKAHHEAEELPDPPEPRIQETRDSFSLERAGSRIGPYKLLEQIGEGGMGVVYMAEQKEPIRRRVTLKIIKPGMDTRQVIARLEAER